MHKSERAAGPPNGCRFPQRLSRVAPALCAPAGVFHCVWRIKNRSLWVIRPLGSPEETVSRFADTPLACQKQRADRRSRNETTLSLWSPLGEDKVLCIVLARVQKSGLHPASAG